jgi:hypothetical protein
VSGFLRSPLLICLLPLGWVYAGTGSSKTSLDLRAPDLHMPVSESATFDSDSQEVEDISVIDASAPAEESSDLHVAHTGIGSVYWAVRHPAEAWRVVVPITPDSESSLSEDIRVKCATFEAAASSRSACP